MLSQTVVALARIALLATAALTAGCLSPAAESNADSEEQTSTTTEALEFDYRVEFKPFELKPGQERFVCQYIPPDGVERWLHAFDTEVGTGSHHVAVMKVHDSKLPAYGPVDCWSKNDLVTSWEGLLPGSQQQSGSSLLLPEGVALELGAKDGLYVQQHYVNATSKTLTAQVVWKAATMAKKDVVHEAGLLSYRHMGFIVPPGESRESMSCAAPKDMRLVMATGHMHERGLDFEASVGDEKIFDNTDWSEPKLALFDPSLEVKKGDAINFTCTYGNETGSDIHEGYGANQEMCLFVGIYYPAVNSETLDQCERPASVKAD